MYPVSERFHQLARQNVPSRCRIYFIPDTVDCTDDEDVIANGTLLVREATDTHSGRRIEGNGGIVISELFGKDTNVRVGTTASNTIVMSLLNADSALTGFAFGRCKIFIDLWDAANSTWLACPMGVFIIDSPARTDTRVVVASGYDQMQKFNGLIDLWWNGLDFTNGLTVFSLIQSIATYAGVSLNSTISDRLLNASHTYYASPFSPSGKTFRDALAYLGDVTGTTFYFDRDGALDAKWYSYAQVESVIQYINGDAPGGGVFESDMLDYSVTPIDVLQVNAIDPDLSTSVGSGSNAYVINANPFLTGANAAAVNALVTPVYNRLAGLTAYRPMSAKAVMDWSLEAGDIINFVRGGEYSPVPLMQQKLTWRGGFVTSEFESCGESTRPVPTEAERAEYRSQLTMHELENTTETLRSMIRDLSGNYTLIQQTVNTIQQTVSAQGITINDILDPTGEMWTAIKTNASTLGDVEKAVNDEISTRQSYIRFLPAEPAIVLGVSEGNEIKLKLVNNVIYFFNGDDDSTDLSLAYAYFNSEESGADRFVAKTLVQVGTDDTAAIWQLKELDNGDLVLDLI